MDRTEGIEIVAKAVHFMHQKYLRTVLKDYTLKDWDAALDWQRKDTFRFVTEVAEGKFSAKKEHEDWLAGKKKKGYVYGPEKNDDPTKGPLTNPSCVEWKDMDLAHKLQTVHMILVACAMCSVVGIALEKDPIPMMLAAASAT